MQLNSRCDRVVPLQGLNYSENNGNSKNNENTGNGNGRNSDKDENNGSNECNKNRNSTCHPFQWTPLHGAIASDNKNLVETLLSKIEINKNTDKNDDNFGCHFYAHFLSTSLATGDVCDIIIDTCSSSISHNILLNSIGNNYYNVRPLHLATRNNNIYAINKLLKCTKIDPNLIDDVSGMTAVHEACQKNNLEILQIFGDLSDRLDLLIPDFNGKTCIDLAIETKNVKMLELLVKMRRNDVLEKVLHARPGNTEVSSILIQLENENMKYANFFGYFQQINMDTEGYIEEKSDENNEEELDRNMTDHEEINIALSESIKSLKIEKIDSILSEDHIENEINLLNIHELKITEQDNSNTVLPTIEMLQLSDKILKILIIASYEAGITSNEFHAHSCYAKGNLYTETTINP